MTTESKYEAVVVGAGVVGLAAAWSAARRGAAVCVLEREHPASGATGVAAGMLAPGGEAAWGEEALFSLNLSSLGLWPGFAESLEGEAGLPVEFVRCGALHVALDRDEVEELRRRNELHLELGLDCEWLTGRECRALEPGLATAVRGGAHVPGEASVDPRRLTAALLSALDRRSVPVHSGAEIVAAERLGAGWRLRSADGRTFASRNVVLCAGAWSGGFAWISREARPPVRPVKGEILALRGPAAVCERIVVGERVYLVPRADGRLIVGATMDERGFDVAVTAGGVHELLREAYRLLPEIAELELVETAAGLRPGTPDNAPLVGWSEADGLLIATGHHRNGVLQAPVTAEAVAALLAGEEPAVDLSPFSPRRFDARTETPRAEVR